MLPTSRRRAVAIFPVIATLALVLAACNGGGATPTAVPVSTPTPSATGCAYADFCPRSYPNAGAEGDCGDRRPIAPLGGAHTDRGRTAGPV